MTKRVTIKDIAKATGLSITAVSLVLNNNASRVPEDTRKKIIETAKELHYVPNFTARCLVSGSSKTIGIIIPDLSNSFFSELVYNLQIELSKHDYEIIVCNSDEKMENEIKYINLLASRGVDLMILAISSDSLKEENNEKIKECIDNSFIPIVLIDRVFDYNLPEIMIDNYTSGYNVAKVLYENNHSNIGLITGPLVLNSSKDRLAGAKKYYEEKGIVIPDSNVYTGKYDFDTGYNGAKELTKNNITAIFCFNDLQAYGVYAYLKEIDKKIPDYISVIGFDNLETSKIITPSLSTVSQPIKEMSLKACDIIMNILNNGLIHDVTKLNTEIILRDSIRRI